MQTMEWMISHMSVLLRRQSTYPIAVQDHKGTQIAPKTKTGLVSPCESVLTRPRT